jgi:serine protease Do
MRTTFTLILAAALLAPSTSACRRPIHRDHPAPLPATTAQAPAVAETAPAGHEGPPYRESFAPIVERVRPAVVNVSSTRIMRPSSPEQSPFFSDPLFRDFFGMLGPRAPHEMKQQALGSGVLISPDGYVITNHHVVQGASEVRVALADGRELDAKIVGADPKTDIALLKIPGHDLPVVPFGDSAKVRVGDRVLAFGDPLGLGQTVTSGIISAKGRGNVGIVDYEDFLQTDAAINPGNSGGPLVDLDGELIGINTAIATSGGGHGNQGLGFAVPVNLAHEVIRQIEEHGHVIRGWLGVAVQDVTPAAAAALGLDRPVGALVGDVEEKSPAAQAGLARGDVIVDVDDRPIADSRGLRMMMAETAPGTPVHLAVLRDGKRRDVTAVLGELPAEEKSPAGPHATSGALGVQVAPLLPDMQKRLGLPEGATGVVVAGVQPGSRAAEAGLRPGDVIEEVDRRPVVSPRDLKETLEKDARRAHLILVWRDGRTHYVAIPEEK